MMLAAVRPGAAPSETSAASGISAPALSLLRATARLTPKRS